MRRKPGNMLRLTVILLMSGVFVGQVAAVLRSQKIGKVPGTLMDRGEFVVADGPTPPPTGPPLRG